LTPSLNQFNLRRLTTKSIRNWEGANSVGLLDVDPQRVIVPILHCPMGLADKVLDWTICEVERLPPPAGDIREACKQATMAHKAAVLAEAQAKVAAEQPGVTPASLASCKEAKQANKESAREEKQAKDNWDEMAKHHRARLFSLSQAFDNVFRENGTKKEHCHGGKCDGVNCIQIVDKAQTLFNDFADAIKAKKQATIADAAIDLKCTQFARMMGLLLDAIWSSVRGIGAGLLPTDTQVQHLRRATSEGKTLWLRMNLTALQPKWHLTFDVHLLHQGQHMEDLLTRRTMQQNSNTRH